MQAAGPRRRRTFALVASCLLASAPWLLSTAGASSGQPIDCVLNPDDPECVTTTTFEETTTTAEQPPPPDEPPTTASDTATSVDQPATTADLDDVTDLTSTTLSVTTSSNLLVPGDGTEGAESTTTSTTVVSTSVDDGGTSDGTLIALVIGGLVAVAALVAFLTWRYWVATRPAALPGP